MNRQTFAVRVLDEQALGSGPRLPRVKHCYTDSRPLHTNEAEVNHTLGLRADLGMS